MVDEITDLTEKIFQKAKEGAKDGAKEGIQSINKIITKSSDDGLLGETLNRFIKQKYVDFDLGIRSLL